MSGVRIPGGKTGGLGTHDTHVGQTRGHNTAAQKRMFEERNEIQAISSPSFRYCSHFEQMCADVFISELHQNVRL